MNFPAITFHLQESDNVRIIFLTNPNARALAERFEQYISG